MLSERDLVLFSDKMKRSDEASKFSILLEFVDGRSNNLVKDEEVSFGSMVEAT